MGDYVGMEGITGVIVKACLNLYPLKERSATFVRIEILNDVIEKVKDLKKNVNVCMVEFLDKNPNLINLFEKKGIPVFGHISVGILHPCFSKEQEKLIPERTRVIQRFG